MREESEIADWLQHVHSARRPSPVEQAVVFLPEALRAERKPQKIEGRSLPKGQPKTLDWSIIGKERPMPTVCTHPLQLPAPEVPRPPVSRRQYGCAICGNKTVACKENGMPYEHKCPHKKWCRTENGHVKCPRCEERLWEWAKELERQSAVARRAFAVNGQRAVRVWVWDPAERRWTGNAVQCCRHPRSADGRSVDYGVQGQG